MIFEKPLPERDSLRRAIDEHYRADETACVRAVLDEEAKALQTFVYDEAARLDVELLEQLREAGIMVNEPAPAPFLEASQSVYEEFASAVEGGAELLAQVRAVEEGGG